MTLYDSARQLVAPDLLAFEQELEAMLARQGEYLTDHERQLYRRGKRLRPLLLLLSAHAASATPLGQLPPKAIAAALSLELAHVGSLIHDDIVDRAPLRRGLPTIHASRGYELALIVGDLQWVMATRLMAGFVQTPSDIELMREFLEAGEVTCRGQLDEMLLAPPDDVAALIQRYYRTIDRKTGKLLSFSCEAGARLVEGMPTAVGSLQRYGALLGRAFQVMDDILDIVRPTEAAGKENLTDLRAGRLSLPLLYAMREAPASHPLHQLRLGQTLTPAELEASADLLRRGPGWLHAFADARALVAHARRQLDLMQPSPYLEALHGLAQHLVDQGFLAAG